MEKVRNKTELYMDFIQYMEKEHNVQFNWEPTRFFSQKLEYLDDDIDINHEAQFYTIQKIVPKILMSLFYNTENIEQLDLQTIKEFSETDFDIYLNNIQNNHYEPDCNLASNLYLYFENHMTDSERDQFEDYTDFKEKFFSETRINKEIFIDTSTLSDTLKNRQILIQVSDITPAEAQSYLKLGQNILESEFASVIKSSNNNNLFKIGHIDNNVDELYGKRNRLEEIKHFIEPLPNGTTMDTGIMRFLMDNTGLSIDKMTDLDKYNEWLQLQNPKTQELIRNFEQELKNSSINPAPAHLTSASLAQMSFIDALTYTVARKIINKDFPTYEELDMSHSEYEEYKAYMLKHHSIQDEQIDPKLRTLGLELQDVTATIIQPYHMSNQDVKNSDTDFKLKNITIKVPLDSLYLDEINPNYYIQPQIGYYTIDPNQVSSFDERSQSRSHYASTDIAKEIKECTIDESHSTSNLSKRFGYSENIKQKIEHDIKKLENEINDYCMESEPSPTASKRKMKM